MPESTQTTLFDLPFDAIDRIFVFLDKASLKNVRLASRSKRLADSIHLFDRVYVSASRKNIDVMRAIAAKPGFRDQVRDLVYDDFRIWESKADRIPDGRALFIEQQAIIDSGEDKEAFRFALKAFPKLRRIVVSSSNEARIGLSTLVTPFVRFVGKNPGCYVWYGLESEALGPYKLTTNWDGHKIPGKAWNLVRGEWRGYCLVEEEFLAAKNAKKTEITEFQMYTNACATGIAHSLFHSVSEDYNRTKCLSSHLTFCELALNVRNARNSAWICFRSGLLKEALSEARSLKEFLFRTNATTEYSQHEELLLGEESFTPLGQIFPISSWPHLRRFGVAHLVVHADDLLSILGKLPPTIAAVELDTLQFTKGSKEWVLDGLRDGLRWRAEKPRLTWYEQEAQAPQACGAWHGCFEDFFEGGANPFRKQEGG